MSSKFINVYTRLNVCSKALGSPKINEYIFYLYYFLFIFSDYYYTTLKTISFMNIFCLMLIWFFLDNAKRPKL